jgi:hypothetical protein
VPDEPIETPQRFAETTPQGRYPMTDYSFTLQAIMELQKSVGALTEAVGGLKTNSAKQADKLDTISHRIYAASVVLTLAVPFVAFLANWLAPIILAAMRSPVSVSK